MENIKKYNEFVNENLYDKVKYSWLKKQMNIISRIEPTNTTRSEILTKRKNELKLNEFQTLYEYWKFADVNSGKFRIANIEVENIKYQVLEYIRYLIMLQLFGDEMKNTNRNLYTDQYNEIKSLPKLTGNLENDKIIIEDVIRNNFYNPKGIVRQSIIMCEIVFKNYF